MKLTKTSMTKKGKLNLVSINKMKDERLVVVVQMRQMERMERDANKDGLFPNHICIVLRRYKDIPMSYSKSYCEREKLITRSRRY